MSVATVTEVDGPAVVTAFAPGRVNLIGEHTDHSEGFCLPFAVHLGITIHGRVGGDAVVLRSDSQDGVAAVGLDGSVDPAAPAWAQLVGAVVAEVRPTAGFVGDVTSDLPSGSGMSSSAALEVALALALGGPRSPQDLARLCQRAEQAATGVPCGILDQLASATGRAGLAHVLDCRTLEMTPVPVPDEIEIRVVHSGQTRVLAGSEYGVRRAQCERAAAIIGPLRDADVAATATIDDPVVRRRAHHVVTENERVHAAARALAAGDVDALGALVDASHASLRDDFEVSTDVVDATVARLRSIEGVTGVRLMGGGFGGCVVVVARPGALDEGWLVRPGPGASVIGGEPGY